MYLSLIQFNDLVDSYNITPADILLRDYLPDCHPTPLSRNGKQYEIERYQGDHASEYCVYEMNNGIRNGTAQLFDDGVLKLKWNMKNGVRDGSYVLFDKGIVVREGKWNDLGKEEERMITNHQSGLKMTIRNNGVIVYEGGFDEEMKRDGYGFEYANGVLKCYGKWKDDQLVEVKQRFLSPSEMIEYAPGATSDLLSHQPVYVGGYEMDEASGIVNRNGHGRVMDPDTGICDYESEWENGKEIESKRISLHEGWYPEPTSAQCQDNGDRVVSPPVSSPKKPISRNSLNIDRAKDSPADEKVLVKEAVETLKNYLQKDIKSKRRACDAGHDRLRNTRKPYGMPSINRESDRSENYYRLLENVNRKESLLKQLKALSV